MLKKMTLTLSLLALVSCGKTLSLESSSAAKFGTVATPGNPDGGRPPLECSADKIVRWKFLQPQPLLNRSVDLLFVVDSSSSLSNKRTRLANTISSFVRQLSVDTDCRIAVMLAHGGASPYSGRLFAPSVSPLVLNTRTQSPADIESRLQITLNQSVPDVDEANGEMMMYSLQKSLEPANLARIQSQGFFRPNAALSTVFISDENDICFRPELNGFNLFPDYSPSFENREVIAYQRYCLNGDATERVTPTSTLAALKQLKTGQLLSFGAIVHIDPARVPQSNQEAIGHGILELVSQSANSVVMDIMDSDYSAGLARLGNLVSSQLKLNTEFQISNAAGISEETIAVTVDGISVGYVFDSTSSTVQISATNAGQAGSVVQVSACQP